MTSPYHAIVIGGGHNRPSGREELMRRATTRLTPVALMVIVPTMAGVVAIGPQHALAGTRCFGSTATIVGTPGDDADLEGTPARDVIVGLGGDDTITGLDGLDRVCGGDGDDIVEGGGAKDFIDGQGGRDRVDGDGGNDDVRGGGGGDRVIGGIGNDTVRDGSGRDRMLAGPGDDTLVAMIGRDAMDGGPGHDGVTYFISGPVRVSLAADRATGEAGPDRLISIHDAGGSDFDDVLLGSAGPNLLDGGHGEDRIDAVDGVGGNDVVLGGTERDRCRADPGDTTASC